MDPRPTFSLSATLGIFLRGSFLACQSLQVINANVSETKSASTRFVQSFFDSYSWVRGNSRRQKRRSRQVEIFGSWSPRTTGHAGRDSDDLTRRYSLSQPAAGGQRTAIGPARRRLSARVVSERSGGTNQVDG